MKYVVMLMLALFVANLNAGELKKSRLLNYYLDASGIDITGAKGDQFYMAANKQIYYRNGINSDWVLLYELPNQPGEYNGEYKSIFKFKFYKNDNIDVFFSADKMLYRIDSETNIVDPVFSTAKDIEFVVFEDDRTIIMEEDIYHVVDQNFQIIETVDMSNLSTNFYFDEPKEYNRIVYLRDEGFMYNYLKQFEQKVEKCNFFGGKNSKILPQTGSIFGSKEIIRMVTNCTNNLTWFEIGNAKSMHEMFIYDSKTDTCVYRGGLKVKIAAPVFELDETGDIFTLSYFYDDNTSYSTNRGSKWHNITDYNFDDLAASQSGILMGYNPEYGIMATTDNDIWYNIPLPGIETSDVTRKTKDFFEITNSGRILAYWEHRNIIESYDDGKTWSLIGIPVQPNFDASFYVDKNENMYFICQSGLYKKVGKQTWTMLTDEMPDYIVESFKIIDADDDKILFAYSYDEESYELLKYSYETGKITSTDKKFSFMQLQNDDTYLFVSADKLHKLVAYNRNLEETAYIIMDEDLQINKALYDKNHNIFIGTNKGLFKAKDWNSDNKRVGTETASVNEMIFNSGDTLFLHYNHTNFLHYLQPGSETIEYHQSSANWSSYVLGIVTKGNCALAVSAGDYGNMQYEYLFTPWIGRIKQSYNAEFYSGEDNQLLIYPNLKGFEVEVINYSSQSNFKTIATTDTVKYDIEYVSNQEIILQVKVRYGLDVYYESDLLHIVAKPGKKEIHLEAQNVSNFDFVYLPKDQLKIKLRTVIASGKPSGETKCFVTNTYNDSTTTIEYNGYAIDYVFDIPEDALNGVYCLKYSGNSENYGKIPEEILYYMIFDKDQNSVEEPNSIITNTNVYPNPAVSNVEVQFEMKEAGDLTCEIYDLNGNKVLNIPTLGYYAAGQSNLSFDISELVSGQYIIFLKAQDKVTAAKLVISK